MARRAGVETPRYTSLDCDKIQNPPLGLFTSADLLWYSEEAYIPTVRLADFIHGEEAHPLTTCRFVKKKIKERPGVGSISTTYHCQFGPADLRSRVRQTAPAVRTTPDGRQPIARSTELGESLQRGCQSHFVVVLYEDRSEAVLIRWLHRNHRDARGAVCHGLIDPTAIFANAHLPHSISQTLREFVERLLSSQVDPVNIIATHNRMVKEEIRTDDFSDGPMAWSRDMQLQYQDVLNIQAAMKAKKGYYSRKDHINLAMWVEANPTWVIHYEPGREDPFVPFSLVWATPWQLKQLAILGHENSVSMDATFGTNEYEFQLFTLIAFDAFHNGLPCVWGLLERHTAEDLIEVLSRVKDRVEDLRVDPRLELTREWKPACFVVDVAPEESLAIRTVMPDVRILLCLYHVRKAWKNQLHMKVRSPSNKAQMNRDLGSMMYSLTGQDPEAASNLFIEHWQGEEPQFIEYYKTHWHLRLDDWVKAFRAFPHSNQNTNGSIERYHHTLKAQLRVDRKVKLGRKVSWLVEKLAGEVEHWYWMRSGQKSQGRVRNTIAESIAMAAITKARRIADADVQLTEINGKKIGHVRSASNRTMVHLVVNYDTDASACTCAQSLEGNACKHQIKCLIMTGHNQIQLLHSLGTKKGTICGGLDFAAAVARGQGLPQDAIVVDINYARENNHQGTPSQAPDPVMPIVEEETDTMQPRNVNHQNASIADVPITKEDLLNFVDRAFDAFGENQNMLKHAVKGLTTWLSSLRDIDARINPADPADILRHMAPTAQPFRTVPGSTMSLRPMTSWVDRMRRRYQRRSRRVINPYTGPNAPKPFTKKPRQRESWQQELDRQARASEAVPENDEPLNGTPNSQASSSSSRGRGRGQGRGRPPLQGGRGRRPGRGSNEIGSSRNPLEEMNFNQTVHHAGQQEIHFFPPC